MGYTHQISTPINYQTENVIKAWKCTKCTKCTDNFTVNTSNRNPTITNLRADKIRTNYIGLSEHRDYPKAGKDDKPSGHHFSLPGHAVSNLQGIAIEHVRNRDPFVLKAREAFLIHKFDSFRKGLNQEP